MQRTLLLAALVLAASRGAFAAPRPVAQWDVVPFQRVAEPFKAGVVAFYDKPFHVEFSVNGKAVASVDRKSANDRTSVEEHWFLLDPAKIDLIVSNHAEMDHSGALPETIARVNPSAVYASTLGLKALEAHFHDLAGKIKPVKSGDAIELGESSLKFVETRMLHWPDSMFTFLAEEGILF